MLDYKNILNNVPGYVLTKNTNSIFTYVNDEFAHLLGFDSGEDCIGITDDDLNCDAAKHADKFREQDRFVLQQQILNSLDFVRYSDKEFHLVLSQKRVFHESDGSVHGIIYHGLDITSELRKGLFSTLLSALPSMLSDDTTTQVSTALIPPPYTNPLTTRQLEVLYYFIYGHSAKSIANILHLSPKTVERHIERLKDYGNCSSRAELIEWAVEQGIFYILPGV